MLEGWVRLCMVYGFIPPAWFRQLYPAEVNALARAANDRAKAKAKAAQEQQRRSQTRRRGRRR